MTDTNESQAPTFGTYLAVLRRRKWWVIAATLLGLAASLGYSLTQPKTYSASAQLLDQSAGVTTGGSQQQITPTEVLTELQLVTSAPVKSAVVRKLGSAPSVSVAQVGATNVIAVTATAASPRRAAAVANAYATAFVNYNHAVTFSNLAAAEAQLSQQITSVDSQVTALGSSPANAADVAALLSQEAALKEQLAQLQVAGATSGGIEVVTPATPPSSPSSPQPALNAVVGLVLGLLFGIGLAFLVENLDDTVYSKDEVERLAVGTQVLALVPSVGSWRSKDKGYVVTMAEPNSMAGEAYRALRTSLQFAALETKARVILVTSPSEAEGKSTTVANLGVVLANAGEKVAIVSCDLRRPRIGQFFGLDERAGLTTVLLGRCPLDAALQGVPGVDGLSFLPAGARPSDPTAVLGSDRLAGLLEELRGTFDVVLVDSPPVLLFTDAVILAQAVDVTFLVVKAGHTQGKDLRRATEARSLVHAAILGVALNEAAPTTGYRHDSNRYGRSKRYEHSKRNGHGDFSGTPATTNGNGNGEGQSQVPARPVPAIPDSFAMPKTPDQSSTG
jgi:capsular exopolysaccharide synthesis family protein